MTTTRLFSTVLAASLTFLTAYAQEFHALWNADRAFIDAGILESYTSIDGRLWQLDEAVSLTFTGGTSSHVPQNVFSPQACAWLCFGNEIILQCSERYEIRSVTIHTMADFPFMSGEATASPGTMECNTDKAVWKDSHPATEICISQPGPYPEIHSPGARVAVTSIDVTYGPSSAGIADIQLDTASQSEIHDLSGRRVLTPGRGLYIVDRRLKRL